ncbi:MAG: hypothetical protein PWR07_1406 [Bacillota bacterium]|nr:hypothetical protein [Bacillota bacterium]
MKSLGIADETFDGLRHAHTSWLIALGMQHPKDIQERLGLRHADFSTTMMLQIQLAIDGDKPRECPGRR